MKWTLAQIFEDQYRCLTMQNWVFFFKRIIFWGSWHRPLPLFLINFNQFLNFLLKICQFKWIYSSKKRQNTLLKFKESSTRTCISHYIFRYSRSKTNMSKKLCDRTIHFPQFQTLIKYQIFMKSRQIASAKVFFLSTIQIIKSK